MGCILLFSSVKIILFYYCFAIKEKKCIDFSNNNIRFFFFFFLILELIVILKNLEEIIVSNSTYTLGVYQMFIKKKGGF